MKQIFLLFFTLHLITLGATEYHEENDILTHTRMLKKFWNLVVNNQLIARKLTVLDDATIEGNATVGHSLTADNITSNSITTNNLIISGLTIINGNLQITGNLSADSANITNNLTAGSITSNSSLSSNTLAVAGNADIGGNLNVTGSIAGNSANIINNLTAGSITSNSSLSSNTLAVAGNANIGGNLNVTGSIAGNSANITNNLTAGSITSNSSLSSNTLAVAGNANIGGNLNVTGGIAGNSANIINNLTAGSITSNSSLSSNTLAVAGNANIGGNLNVTGSITGNNMTLSNTGSMNTAIFANYVPAYAPLTAAMAGTVNIYGDSFAFGAFVLPSERWPNLLCNYFGSTENMYASNGTMINDSIQQIYTTYPPGTNVTNFQAFGTNDIGYGPANDNIFDEFRRTTETMVMFTCLPDSQKVNARDASTTGVWTTTPILGLWGLQTSTANSTLTATVTGQFVCIAMPCVSNTIFWDVTIDGTPIVVAQQVTHNSPVTQLGGDINDVLFVYDTGSNAPHTILINYNASSTATGYIAWLAGFNINNPNCNTTFLVSPTIPDYSVITPLSSGMERRRQCWFDIQRSICRRLRTEYGLPVYFIDMSYPWTFGMLRNDTYHPNPNGHQYMFNRARSVILNGEFNYLT
ncbi:MAG: hypothetical protein WC707_00665 [Candidatus Babeliaceae bacterium]